YASRSELLAGMVDEWWSDAARGVMVVDTSNAERDVSNRLAQQRRLGAGELGAEVLTLQNGCQVRAGDRVIFREIKELPSPPTGSISTSWSPGPARERWSTPLGPRWPPWPRPASAR